jgi:hypothetical protein
MKDPNDSLIHSLGGYKKNKTNHFKTLASGNYISSGPLPSSLPKHLCMLIPPPSLAEAALADEKVESMLREARYANYLARIQNYAEHPLHGRVDQAALILASYERFYVSLDAAAKSRREVARLLYFQKKTLMKFPLLQFHIIVSIIGENNNMNISAYQSNQPHAISDGNHTQTNTCPTY